MTQASFLTLVFATGLLLGCLARRHVPLRYTVPAGLIWGSVIFVVLGMGILVVGLPIVTVIPAIGAFNLVALLLNIHHRTITVRDIGWLVLLLLVAFGVATLADRWNISTIMVDGMYTVTFGSQMGEFGLAPYYIELNLRGIFLFVVHSVVILFDLEYLYAFQPLLSLSFLFLFVGITWKIAYNVSRHRLIAFLCVALATVFVFTNFMIVYHLTYIMTNWPSAIFLFASVGFLWLGMSEDDVVWIRFSMLALLGFSLMRIEAPLFSLIILTLVIAQPELTYGDKLTLVLPVTVFLAVWYLNFAVLNHMDDTKFFSVGRAFLFIGSMLSFSGLLLLSKLRWVDLLLPLLPKLMVLALIIGCVVLLQVKPRHIWTFIRSTMNLMLLEIIWGMAWGVMLALFLASWTQKSFRFESIFVVSLISLFLFTLLVSGGRPPYRLGWDDSGDRLFMQIFPILSVFLSVKYLGTLTSIDRSTTDEIPVDSSS